MEKLLAIVQIKVPAIRDGMEKKIPLEEIVPGDVVLVSAGDVIPGDCLVLESKTLYLDEATLTGETYPVGKSVIVVDAGDTPVSAQGCSLDGNTRGERERESLGCQHG